MGDVDRLRADLSTLDLRRLLIEMKETRSNVHVKFRLVGQPWKPNFLKILVITERGVVLVDELDSTLIFLTDLSRIMQFQVDANFRELEALHEYSVEPTLE
jgi:hypothetical protein